MRTAHGTLRTAWLLVLLTIPPFDVERSFAWQANGTRLTRTPLTETHPSIVSDGAGGAIVVWTTYVESGRTELRAQRLDLSGKMLWGSKDAGVPICTAERTRFDSRVIPDGTGGIFLSWMDQRTWAQAYAHRIAANGSAAAGWPVNGVRVAPSGGTQFEVGIAADGTGGMYACWRDERDSLRADIWLQRLTGSGEVATGWPSGGLRVTRAKGHQEQPTMIPDGSGGVVICWLDYRNEWDECKSVPVFACGGDVYAQRILASGAVAPGWPHGGLPVCVMNGRQDMPVILSDGDGGAIIGWRDFRTGVENSDSDVYAERVTASGRLAWGSGSGVPIAALEGTQWYPIAVSDGRKGAYFLWQDGRPAAESVFYLNHVDPGGRVWSNGGRSVRGGDVRVYSSAILGADGHGDAYVAFTGKVGTSLDYGLRMQKYTPRGEPVLGRSGAAIPVCDGPGIRFVDPSPPGTRGGPIFANNEGVYVAWTDIRKPWRSGIPDYDIYVQRLTPMGTIPTSHGPSVLGIEPNPASRVATLSFVVPMDGSGVVTIYDVHGRKRRSHSVSGPPQARVVRELQVRDLPSGIYFVRVTDRSGREQAQAKLVVLR